jgi:hypothetical protein
MMLRPTVNGAETGTGTPLRFDGRLVRRCAWCGRYDLDSGRSWTGDVSEGFRRRVTKRTTDTICPDCLAGLEAQRLARPGSPAATSAMPDASRP